MKARYRRQPSQKWKESTRKSLHEVIGKKHQNVIKSMILKRRTLYVEFFTSKSTQIPNPITYYKFIPETGQELLELELIAANHKFVFIPERNTP